MAQYIDKAAIVAEIESLLDKGKYHEEYDCSYRDGNNSALYALKNKLDSLEVKEVVAEQEGKCNGILNTIIGKTWHIKIPLDKAGLKHGDKVKIFIAKGE